MTYAILTALAALLAAVAWYRRKANKATTERQKLRDELVLIDTKKELERLNSEVSRAEKDRIRAADDYRTNPWRPGDDPGGTD
jgi:ElaB/YqjD/DUF883 family membrane-anchored ribosome-binding protein